MIYDTGTIRAVVQSAAAKRALNYISPVYGEAENFLHILNAAGLSADELNAWVDEIVAAAMPQTVTAGGLTLWETELGIRPGAEQSTEQRRQAVLSKLRSSGASNPYRIAQTAGAAVGCDARTVENTGVNKFTIWMHRYFTDEAAIRRAVDRIKPAHLIYDVKNEEFAAVPGTVCAGGRFGQTYTLVQED